MVRWHPRLNGHEFNNLQELVMDREAWSAAVTIYSDLEPPKVKSVSIVSPSICHEVMEPDAMIFIL